MKKVILWALFLISVLFLSLRLSSIPVKYLNPAQKSGIKILSIPEGADVAIDGISAGKTPFEDATLEAEEVTLNLSSGDASWSGRVILNKGTVTIVNRELSTDEASSSGEVLTLKDGNGVNVISNPQDADIEVDGKLMGKTPVRLSIQSGEHLFVLNKKGFLKRSIKAVVPPGYSLGLKVDLAISEIDLSGLGLAPVTTTP
ncbi:MAG: PEGA domain-containing protein, partial [Microgenomates group bacterium Gr01-1014_80]